MKSFLAFEMQYTGNASEVNLNLIPFSDIYYSQYEQIYNECFFEMREALEVHPLAVYSDISQLSERKKDIFLLLENNTIIGSVACYGTEIDDLIVSRKFQGKGYGRKLLQWAISHIRESSDAPITLHVADWNKKAIRMYLDAGFVVIKKQQIK